MSVASIFMIDYLFKSENNFIRCVAGIFGLFLLIGFFVLDVVRIIRYYRLSTKQGED